MMFTEVTWHDNKLEVDEIGIQVEHPVKDAFLLKGKVVVLYQWGSTVGVPVHPVRFHNLEAYDLDGNKLWTAELPHRGQSPYYVKGIDDGYIRIRNHEPLVVYSWSGFDCTIDPSNGKIISVRFTK